MLRFLHGYLPGVWEAQVKAGLVREGDGIRFCQNILLDDDMKFNRLAAKDGKLYNVVKELKGPFYVDRLQGGCYIDTYTYDSELINEYKEMLGDNFWGFQMHEWLSNYASDLDKLSELSKEEWTEENIEALINKKFPYPVLFLESMTAKEMAEFGKPETFEEFYANMTSIYKKRQLVGDLIPVDSSMLMYAFELDAGATRIMPEVGAQTCDARIQICYARGMTRKDGLHFGVYYEPWGRTPYSINEKVEGRPPCTACCYQKDEKNEWGIGDSADFPFHTDGENGGSSRSLQKRIFLYSYLSGAEFMSEEWGVCNVFYDWKDCELSPYGQVKKDFVDFMKKYPDVGEKLVPVGLIVPKDLSHFDNVLKKPAYKRPFEYSTDIQDKVASVVERVLSESSGMLGTETFTMLNSNIPDAVDMLNEGYGDISRYEHLIDATFSEDLAKEHANIITADEVCDVLRDTLPCYVEGGLHWLVNRCESGGYYLTVFNHSGVVRTLKEGEFTLKEADKTVTITFKEEARPLLLEGQSELTRDGDVYKLTVSAGDFAFIKF